MLTQVIAHRDVFTAFTGQGESLVDLQQLPELKNKQLVLMEQVHGPQVAEVSDAVSAEATPIPGVDALLTRNHNLALVVRVADCLPILLYHEPSQTLGAIHAGRKSTEQQLTKNVLHRLPSTASPIWLWLGPHICETCYQINRETDEHYQLMERNLDQLYEVFQNEAVELSINDYCTAHENEKFHSYRQEGQGVKMNYGVIAFR